MPREPFSLWPRSGLWRHGDFLKLWSAETISQFGTQVSQLALPFIAITILDASAFAVAALGTVEFLPFLLFTLPAGVWVDRLRRRMILIVADYARAALLFSVPVAYAFDALTLAQLFVVGFFVGTFTVFFDVSYQSYLPSLVQRDQIIEGNSKLEVSRNVSQITGPGVAGGLIGLITAPYAVLVDAISFVASGTFLNAIRKQEQRPVAAEGQKPHMRAELWEGLQYVVRHPLLRPQALCTGTSNFFSNVMFSIFLVYAVRTLDLSAGEVGLILTLGGPGGLVGALLSQRITRRFGVGPTTVAMTLLFGGAGFLVPLAPQSFPHPFLIVSGLIFGFSVVVYNITQVSLRQAITPERIQGRMNSVMRFLVWGTIPLGSLTGGALASTIGLRETLFVGAVGGLLSGLPIILSRAQRTLGQIPEPQPEPAPVEAAAAGGIAAVSPSPVQPDA
jgi:MFS family permease